jgi:hypothetical protein
MKGKMKGLCIPTTGQGYLRGGRIVRFCCDEEQSEREDRPSSPSSRTSAQSYPNAKSVRGSSLLTSAAGFWRRADTRVLLPVEGWPRTRIFFAGIEREEETELRMVDQRSCGGASGEDGRESSFIVELFVEKTKCERVRASDRVPRRRLPLVV